MNSFGFAFLFLVVLPHALLCGRFLILFLPLLFPAECFVRTFHLCDPLWFEMPHSRKKEGGLNF